MPGKTMQTLNNEYNREKVSSRAEITDHFRDPIFDDLLSYGTSSIKSKTLMDVPLSSLQ